MFRSLSLLLCSVLLCGFTTLSVLASEGDRDHRYQQCNHICSNTCPTLSTDYLITSATIESLRTLALNSQETTQKTDYEKEVEKYAQSHPNILFLSSSRDQFTIQMIEQNYPSLQETKFIDPAHEDYVIYGVPTELRQTFVQLKANRVGEYFPTSVLWFEYHLFFWKCSSNCQYQCMHHTEALRASHGEKIVKYYGKWPFTRLVGFQEFFSSIFSICNMIPHIYGLILLRKITNRKKTQQHDNNNNNNNNNNNTSGNVNYSGSNHSFSTNYAASSPTSSSASSASSFTSRLVLPYNLNMQTLAGLTGNEGNHHENVMNHSQLQIQAEHTTSSASSPSASTAMTQPWFMRNVYTLYSLVCINTWIWSTVFHARDFLWTERADYFCASIGITMSISVALIRIFQVHKPFKQLLLTAPIWILCLAHISYLHFIFFDYGWNMLVSLTAGVSHSLLWCVWGYFFHGRDYNWKCYVSTLTLYLAASLEVYDFPPLFGLLDAHAMWHGLTPPIAYLWYQFLKDDAIYEINQLQQLEHKTI